jgi:hypothetical protein
LMVLQIRRLVPWTLLRVLTAILRARKGHAASSSSPGFPKQTELEWTLKVKEPGTPGSMAPRLDLLEPRARGAHAL